MQLSLITLIHSGGKKAESWKQISLESNSNFKQQKAKQRVAL